MGTLQNLDILSMLIVLLGKSKLYGTASDFVGRLVRNFRCPRDVLASVFSFYREFNVDDDEKSDKGVIFDMLINGYRKVGFLNEAVDMFMEVKGVGIVPTLLSCNSLLRDLLKLDELELFWKVHDGMCEMRMD